MTRQHHAHSLALFAALVCTALTACSIPPPKARISSVSLTRLTVSKVELRVGMELQNPNTFSMRIENLDWSLELYEEPFVNGSMDFSRDIFFELRPLKRGRLKVHEGGVLRDGHKLLMSPNGTTQLYDLETDPREMNPTTGEDAPELRAALADFQARVTRDSGAASPPPELSDDMKHQLQVLGYVPE